MKQMTHAFGKDINDPIPFIGSGGPFQRFKNSKTIQKALHLCLGTLLALLALNAFGGGWYGMSGAEGVPLELLEGSPFKDYFIPSLVLFLVIGGPALAASIAVFKASSQAKHLSYAVVIIVFGWLIIQVSIIGYVSWMQPLTAATSLIILILTRLISIKPAVL